MSESTDSAVPNPYAAPLPVSDVAPPQPAAMLPLDGEIRVLFDRGKNGAAWFYWIAALSLINTIMVLSGSDTSFALGMGVTLIVDSFAAEFAKQAGGGASVIAVAVVFDVIVLGMVVLCGWLSKKRILPVFAIGMLLYLLDGLVCLLLGSIVCIAIHAFALWSMWSGFAAYRQLNVLEQRIRMPS
jgi:hypothetical protein